MECTACGRMNRTGRKFCGGCGAPLVLACAACGARNDADERFCGECGAELSAALPPPDGRADALAPMAATSSAEAVPFVTEGERRRLTVMFCDLADSTPHAARLDPEDLRELLRAYHHIAAEVVGRHAGYIAHYMGDGLLVFFGYPRAYGDDARRAVQAGLELVRAMGALNDRLPAGPPVAVRVGIHTGLVVVGAMGEGATRQTMDVVGETPNIAARLQGLAELGSVLISEDTLRLVVGFFEHEALGPRPLKGVARPLAIYRILRETRVQTRLEVVRASGLTPLIGRQDEVRLLESRWREVQAGAARVVLICGEAGIGKSRLVQELTTAARRDDHLRMEIRCSPYHQSSALYPIIEYLQRAIRFQLEDTATTTLAKLEQLLAEADLPLADFVPLIANLLSIPLSEHYAPLDLAPDVERQRMIAAIVAWLRRLCERRPVLLIVEDLHWVDPSTLEVLTAFVEHEPVERMLTVLTYRPEFTPPWPLQRHFSLLTLTRLDAGEVRTLVEHVARGKPLPPEVLDQVVTRTDGVPLFVEELTHTILESGLVREEADVYVLAGPLSPFGIPTTLHDSLMARLDRLDSVKEVAQLGAVLGRTFSYAVLRAVSPLDEESLRRALAQLVQADLLHERGTPPDTRYVFRHALIQEAAYTSLLNSRRQQFHQRIARVLERQFPEVVETQPELLARHYTEAHLPRQAIAFWLQAGRRAIERSANLEAIDHLNNGLALLAQVPDEQERQQAELALQIALAAPIMATRGTGAVEVEGAYLRARELCLGLGDDRQLFAILRGLATSYLSRADYAAALQLCEQMLMVAEQAGHPTLLLGAHNALGQTMFWTGELQHSREHLEKALRYYDPERHRPHGARAGHDPGMTARMYLALCVALLGYPEQALELSANALDHVRQLDHPVSVAFAFSHAALLQSILRDAEATKACASRAVAVGEEHGFAQWLIYGNAGIGSALVLEGAFDEGIARLHESMAGLHRIGMELTHTFYLALLAEAHLRCGQLDAGLAAVAQAQTIVERTGERFYASEHQRLRGELLLAGSVEQTQNVESALQAALATARRHGAMLLELRAATSLYRFTQQHGRAAASRSTLQAIYESFTEGFGTPDLLEAHALLALV